MKKVVLLLASTGTLFFIAMSFLFLFVYPSSDDFCFGSTALKLGWFDAQKYWYNTWFGRYLLTAATTSVLYFKSYNLYRVILFLTMILHFPAVFFLFKSSAGKKEGSLFYTTVITFCFLTQYFSGMPGIMQGVYWFPGVVTYSWSILGLLLFLILFSLCTEFNKERTFFTAALFIGFFLIGLGEISMLLLIILLLFFLINDRKNFLLWLLLAVFCGFSFFVIFAPGNSIRSQIFSENNHDILFSILGTMGFLSAMLFTWFMNPLIWMFSAVFTFYKINGTLHFPLLSKNSGKILILLIVLLFGSVFPVFWAIGEPPPARSLNVTYFLFLFIVICFLNFLSDKYSIFMRSFFINHFKIKIAFVIMLLSLNIVFIHSSDLPEKRGGSGYYIKHPVYATEYIFKFYGRNNFADIFLDIVSGKVTRYENNLAHRENILSKCNDSEECVINKIYNPPRTIFFEDITSDTTHWYNVCYSDYHNKKSVKTGE